jgi:toxin ParE1/3/4
MRRRVYLTNSAVRDLEEIQDYLIEHESSARAEHVLGRIRRAILALSEFPDRGNYPRELLAFGVREYREVFFKPYRVIYRVHLKAVYVYLIADGRRDMQSLLQRRLVEP